jgi:hypothetical protein
VPKGSYLTIRPDDSAIADLYNAIGDIIVRFPLLHCEECAITLKKWLKHRRIPGKIWRLSTQHDDEDFILSDRHQRIR